MSIENKGATAVILNQLRRHANDIDNGMTAPAAVTVGGLVQTSAATHRAVRIALHRLRRRGLIEIVGLRHVPGHDRRVLAYRLRVSNGNLKEGQQDD